MLSHEEHMLRVLEDRLKDSDEWLLDLVFEVVVIIDRQIVLQDIQRVLAFLVPAGIPRSFDHYIGHSVTKRWGSGLVALAHLLCQRNVSLLRYIEIFEVNFFLRLRWCPVSISRGGRSYLRALAETLNNCT